MKKTGITLALLLSLTFNGNATNSEIKQEPIEHITLKNDTLAQAGDTQPIVHTVFVEEKEEAFKKNPYITIGLALFGVTLLAFVMTKKRAAKKKRLKENQDKG